MNEIRRSIDVAAPPEAIFRELVDLHRLARWSVITAAHDGPGAVGVGDEFRQTIRVGGVKLPTRWTCVENDPPRSVAYEATAPAGGRLHMRQTVAPTGDGSRVDLAISYQLPGGAVGAALDRLYVRRRNERDAELALRNLKVLVEGQQPRR